MPPSGVAVSASSDSDGNDADNNLPTIRNYFEWEEYMFVLFLSSSLK